MQRNGFTLVELSIVLVILGLLTGGILSGQSLIRSAELRSITTQLNNFKVATNAFRNKYLALPGDMNNAEAFWGTMPTGTCPTASGGTGTQTCNGDGNGKVGQTGGAANSTSEKFTFWQHLSNAGLIEGSYSGTAGSGAAQHGIIGENVPAGKISNGGWWASDFDNTAGSTYDYAMNFTAQFGFGANISNAMPTGPILAPEEAWGIDTKIDDGKPAYGKVIAVYWDDQCASADDGTSATNDFDASYNLSETDTLCALRFIDNY